MMKLICLLGWRYMLNFYPWSQEPHAFCWLRYEQAILLYNSLKCWFVFKYLMCFTFLDILGGGHRIWGPPSDLGDAHSGLAVAPWPFYHSTLHLCSAVFCESDFSRRGMFHITRSSFNNRTWMLCVVWMWVGAVATRKRSLRRADRKPGKGSGHAEAHCSRERRTHATRKTHSCQTSKRSSYCLAVQSVYACLI